MRNHMRQDYICSLGLIGMTKLSVYLLFVLFVGTSCGGPGESLVDLGIGTSVTIASIESVNSSNASRFVIEGTCASEDFLANSEESESGSEQDRLRPSEPNALVDSGGLENEVEEAMIKISITSSKEPNTIKEQNTISQEVACVDGKWVTKAIDMTRFYKEPEIFISVSKILDSGDYSTSDYFDYCESLSMPLGICSRSSPQWRDI